jgi:two-component system OmpR family sensor kinase
VTIRRRLTLYYSATILGIVLFTLAMVGYALYQTVLTSGRDASRATALQIARELERGAEPDAALLSTVQDGNVLVVIRDASGAILVETDHPVAGIGADERAAAADIWGDALASGQPASATPVEAFVYALPVSPRAGTTLVVESWVSFDVRGESSVPLDKHLAIVLPAVLAAGLLGAFLHVRGALKPVESLATAAEGITASDLSRRLPDRGTRDELDRVAASFNGVLARLEASFAEREEVLARQRRFTSDASHELRTPLASILGYARMLRAWGLSDERTAAEGVAMIEREATRLVRMTEHLLDLARGDEGGSAVHQEPHDLRELVGCEVDTIRAASGDGPAFALTTPGEPVVAEVDPAAVRRALGAILENAARFSPRDGSVRVSVRSSDGWASVKVVDTGPGIVPEHQPHIFDRFYQADPSRATTGSGLGLAIAKQVAERHGGRIEVATEPGHGATFTLRLPLTSAS